MLVENENVPIVIDSGSWRCKAGFAGDDTPRSIIPSLVGHPTRPNEGDPTRYYWVGDDALSRRRGLMRLSYPVDQAVIMNWEDVEKIWHHTFFNELRVDPCEHPVLLSEASFSPRANRERTAQVMFEVFNVPAMSVRDQAVLSLSASGRTTGCVLDCGEGVCRAVPVYEGLALPDAVSRLDLAGTELTVQMMQLANERGYGFGTLSEQEIVRDMKEKHAYVALDYDQEMAQAAATVAYELPDGTVIHLGSERFRCAEPLFQPILSGRDLKGVQDCVSETILQCDIDIRSELYGNIVLSGGTTLLPGFEERLTKELTRLTPQRMKLTVLSPPERQDSVWIGGSILTSLPSFQSMWVTKAEYEEVGPSIVSRRCL
jgi:actin-related protein